jgi:hypothetical protein
MTIQSDTSLQTATEVINPAASIAWSKQLSWVDFKTMLAKELPNYSNLLAKMKVRLAVEQAKVAAIVPSSTVPVHRDVMYNDHNIPIIKAVTNSTIQSIEDMITALTAKAAEPAPTATASTQAGLVAQQVQALVTSTGYGSFVITTLPNGKLELDYSMIQCIVNYGLQLRLAAVEKFLAGILGSGITV